LKPRTLLLKQPCSQFSRQCKQFNGTQLDGLEVVVQQQVHLVVVQVAAQGAAQVAQAADKQHRKKQLHLLLKWLLPQLVNLENLLRMPDKWLIKLEKGLVELQRLLAFLAQALVQLFEELVI
jgi:hypothetical protein